MITRRSYIVVIIVFLTILTLLLSSCGPRPTIAPPPPATASVTPTDTPPPTQTQPPVPTAIPLPALTWDPEDGYFSLNGSPAFLFSRNPAGYTPNDWNVIADMAHEQGDQFLRVLTSNASMGGFRGYGYTPKGKILVDWSDNWEQFFDLAEADGLYVIPIFASWIDWNTEGYNTWKDNPFNSINGGPTRFPREIFRKDSPTQILFLKWVSYMVTRWQDHKNILAWEVFSEVNLVNGISQAEGIYLAEQLAKVVREADSFHRPVTISVADWSGWTDFLSSDTLDFISLHPYSADGKQDIYVLWEVREYMDKYDKPVLIGESGLHAAVPDSEAGAVTVAPNARIGIQHAIWAQLVSGAMNGRALWWEDGYGIYFPRLGMPWIKKYTDVEAPTARFIAGVDMTGFKPIPDRASGRIFGAALGNEEMIIGWYRDASCEPPDWNTQPVVSGQTAVLTVPGTAASWQVDFYSTKTGTELISSAAVDQYRGTITITLPDFTNDIAFKIYAQK